MKKKIFLVLFAAIAGTSVLFADGTLIGELYYNLNTSKKTATVTYQTKDGDNYADLTTVNIPATVTYNGDTYNVTAVGQDAFMDCINLTSVTLPDGITSISRFAFRMCSFTSLTIPKGLKTMDYDAFFGCDKIISMTWNAVNCDDFEYASPWEYAGVGYSATAPIASVVFSDGVKRIPAYLFARSEALKLVTIPNSVTSIGESAFTDCANLNAIYNYGETPANAYSDSFDGVNKSTCKLYVPKNSINAYKNAPVWRDFYSISAIEDVQALENAEADNLRSAKVIIDGKVYINRGDKTYTLQGQEVK